MKIRKARPVSNMRNYPVERYLVVLQQIEDVMSRWETEHRRYASTFASIPGHVINDAIAQLNILLKADTPDRESRSNYRFAEWIAMERQTIREVASGLRQKPYVRKPAERICEAAKEDREE